MLTLYCIMCFSDFIPDVAMRANIGYASILIISSHLFGHIFFMAKDNIHFYDMDTCLIGHKIDPVIGGVQFNGMHLSIGEAAGIGADVDSAYLRNLESCTI